MLVIDDLHELDSDRALRWLELFVGQLPDSTRLVLTSREDLGSSSTTFAWRASWRSCARRTCVLHATKRGSCWRRAE